MGAKMTVQTHMLGDKRVGQFVNMKTLDTSATVKEAIDANIAWTASNGIENDSEKPDDDWQDKTCKFVLIRDSVEYPLLASFKNP